MSEKKTAEQISDEHDETYKKFYELGKTLIDEGVNASVICSAMMAFITRIMASGAIEPMKMYDDYVEAGRKDLIEMMESLKERAKE